MKKLSNGNYELTRKELKKYLEGYYKNKALERGGVDNWDWYGDSLYDYCEDKRKETGNKDYDIEDLVKDTIDNLEKENLWNGK